MRFLIAVHFIRIGHYFRVCLYRGVGLLHPGARQAATENAVIEGPAESECLFLKVELGVCLIPIEQQAIFTM